MVHRTPLLIFLFLCGVSYAGVYSQLTGTPSVDADGTTMTSQVNVSDNIYASKAFLLALADYWINSSMATGTMGGLDYADFTCEFKQSGVAILGDLMMQHWNGTAWITDCQQLSFTLPTSDTSYSCAVTSVLNTSGTSYLRCRVVSLVAVTSTFSFDFLGLEIDDNTPPIVQLLTPDNITQTFNTSLNLTMIATDNMIGDMNCTLFVDGASNQSNASVPDNTPVGFPLDSIPTGTHTWQVLCSDSVGNVGTSEEREFTILSMAPYTSAAVFSVAGLWVFFLFFLFCVKGGDVFWQRVWLFVLLLLLLYNLNIVRDAFHRLGNGVDLIILASMDIFMWLIFFVLVHTTYLVLVPLMGVLGDFLKKTG